MDLFSVATANMVSSVTDGGLMSLQVEGSSQVQVPRALMQAFLQQDPNHPGLETVRLPSCADTDDGELPTQCREVESEICLVCRRCGRAYPQESTLLAHQRSCYLGNQQRRGALRLIQYRYVCCLCDNGRNFSSVGEARRHVETMHQGVQERQRKQPQPQQMINSLKSPEQQGEEANPLTDEMEDVVNQITLLAARAAAESSTARAGQDNNNEPEAKRQKLVQEVAAIGGAR